jgi:hypothetical protein
MANNSRPNRVVLFCLLTFSLTLTTPSSLRAQGKKFDGRWQLAVSIPVAPGSSTLRTLNLNLDVAPRGASLVGRLTVTDDQNRTVGGVWRQAGKRVTLSYELPCPDEAEAPCATLIIMGKIIVDTGKFKKGKAIVMWDTPNDRDPSFYDTTVGFVTGARVL